MSRKTIKTINVTEEVHYMLGDIGTTRESYSDVIRKVVLFYKKHYKS